MRLCRGGYWGDSSEAKIDEKGGDLRRFYSYSFPEKLKGRVSMSGPGSDLGLATSVSLQFVVDVIREYNVRTMMDVPCGDVNWILEARETDVRGFSGLIFHRMSLRVLFVCHLQLLFVEFKKKILCVRARYLCII